MKRLLKKEVMESALFKYLISGGLAAAVHYAILIGLVNIYAVNPFIATFIGLTIATFINYPLQYYWTFKNFVPHYIAFPKYIMVTSIAYSVNLFCFWVLHELIGIHYIIAQMIATGIALAINFVVNSRFTFSHPAPKTVEQQP